MRLNLIIVFVYTHYYQEEVKGERKHIIYIRNPLLPPTSYEKKQLKDYFKGKEVMFTYFI